MLPFIYITFNSKKTTVAQTEKIYSTCIQAKWFHLATFAYPAMLGYLCTKYRRPYLVRTGQILLGM